MAQPYRMPPQMVVRGGLMTVMFVTLAPGLLAQSSDRVHMEALARRATERLRTLQQEADALASQERTLLGDLRKLEIDRQLRAEELRQIAAESSQVATELTANTQRTNDLERQESWTAGISQPSDRHLQDGARPVPADVAIDD